MNKEDIKETIDTIDTTENEIKDNEAVEIETVEIEASADDTTSDEKVEVTEFSGEDNLELFGMSSSDRRKAKRERLRKNMEGMSKKEKISYLVYYYKWPVILSVLAVIVIGYIGVSVYKNSRPVALGYAVINCASPKLINQDVIDDYMDFYDFDNGYQIVDAQGVRMSVSEYEELSASGTLDNNTDYSQFPLLCWNGYYDIIFTDADGLEYCSKESVIEPLDTAFTNDLNEIIYSEYADIMVESPNYDDQPELYALDVTDNEIIKELNLNLDEVYICFPATSPQNKDRDRNMTNRKRILNFIFELDLEI